MDSSERRFNALDFLQDYSKGTLWWVHNRLWNEKIPGFVWKKNSKHHPGLSISRKKVEGLYNTVPMLIGTSRRPLGQKVLPVRHMSPEGSAHHDKPGYFFTLRPCHLRFNDFGHADGIEQNGTKPRLERDEMQKLDELLSGKEA